MHKPVVAALVLCLAASPLSADDNLSKFSRRMYSATKALILRSAEQMPEEHYAFKPADSVRTYGEILGHIAASQPAFCGAMLKTAQPKFDKTKTSKADRIAALKEAFAYCDAAYESMTDATGASETVKFHGGDTPKLGVLTTNIVHTVEHYGNLVTYMRMKNLVPPTSDPDFMAQLAAR